MLNSKLKFLLFVVGGEKYNLKKIMYNGSYDKVYRFIIILNIFMILIFDLWMMLL